MSHIFANIDVLVLILQFLEVHQQINLCRVCDQFKAVIVQYIWRRKYRRVRVYQLNHDLFILNPNCKRGIVGRAAFGYERFERVRKNEMEMFLFFQKENIFALELCGCRSRRIYTGLPIFLSTSCNFPNLRALKLKSVQQDWEHFNHIESNSLSFKFLIDCVNEHSCMYMLKTECDHICSGLFDLGKALTEFSKKFLPNQPPPFPLTLYEFFIEHNLKVLHFNRRINNLDNNAIPVREENTCKEFHVTAFNQSGALETFSNFYVSAFINLQILTLEGSINKLMFCSTNFIQRLAVSAPKLKNLKLKHCIVVVKDFRILESLTDVTFDNCMSLTWKNMNQLLQSPNIHNYCSNVSNYLGEFDTISLSDSLESLTLVGFEERFQNIYADDRKPYKNLKFLHYHDGTLKRFPTISQSFPNLEVLQILPYHLVADDFLRLTNLEVYENPHYNHEITLRNLLFILKHPKLRELSLTYCQKIVELTFMPTPAQLKTNIQYANINFTIFTPSREFWNSILKINPRLTMIVRAVKVFDLKYYYKILKDEKFPRKYIKLSGFHLDLDQMYNKPEIAEEKMSMATQLALHRDLHIIM